VSDAFADVEDLALPALGADLRTYSQRCQRARAEVEQQIARVEVALQTALGSARGGLAAEQVRFDQLRRSAEADLNAAAYGLSRAQSRLETIQKLTGELLRAVADYQPRARRFDTVLDLIGRAAERELDRAGAALAVYQGAGPGPGPGGAPVRGGGPGGPTQPAGFPAGHYLVPLALIDASDSAVTGPESFGKGYSPYDLEWAHEAFRAVVAPTLAAGGTIEDLRRRDAAEGRSGARSYADTHAGFLGGDAIALDARGGSYTVLNGYHRIWVAQRMGLSVVPARVSGP
jgi:hypothetical protein